MYIFESIKTAETCATFSTEAVTFSRAMRKYTLFGGEREEDFVSSFATSVNCLPL